MFRQGDRSDLVYTVDAGEVDVFRVLADGGEEHLATVGPGHYVGELGPMLGFPRSATVRARDRRRADGVRRAPVPPPAARPVRPGIGGVGRRRSRDTAG